MFDTILTALRGNAELFRTYPVPYTIGLTLVVTIIYFKWRLITKAQEAGIKNSFAGWQQDGDVSADGVLVMHPVNLRSLGVLGLAFWGGGAWLMGFVADPKPDEVAKNWLTVAILGTFAAISVFLFLMSFDRIFVDGKRIARLSWLAKPFTADLETLDRVTPLSKTIAGGVRLHFADGRQLKIPARNSGYRQLLEILATRDLKLRMMLSALNRRTIGEI